MKNHKLMLGVIALVFLLLSVNVAKAGIFRETGTIYPSYQDAKGGVKTQTSLISGNGEVITGVLIAASGTAQTVGLFDTASTATIAVTNGKFEATVPANTTQYFDFSTRPLRTTSGLSLFASRTDGYVVTYTQQ